MRNSLGAMRSAAVIAGSFVLVSPAEADWPQWRGPNRDGHATAISAPAEWPQALTRKWKVEVGEGHSSPVVAGGAIFVHARMDDREVVSALRPDTGEVIWRQGYDAPYTMNPAAAGHGKGVKSTPVVSDGRVYTLGISEMLSCWDATSGKLLWRRGASPEATGWRAYSPMVFGQPLFQKESAPATFGTAMSPLVDNGLVIVHLGAAGLAAFDAATGDDRWRWADDRPGYASPIVVDLDGARQIVTQSEKYIVSVSESDGRLLWKIPYTTNFNQNSVTPVAFGRSIILSGLNNGTMAVRPVKRGDDWATEKLWENTDVSMYMSSPLLSGHLLFGFSHRNKGQFFCLDARSGATLWTTPGREGENAAIVSVGNELLVLKDNAELIVARKNPKTFEALQRYMVADTSTWAHPVALEKGILIKDLNSLAFWAWK